MQLLVCGLLLCFLHLSLGWVRGPLVLIRGKSAFSSVSPAAKGGEQATSDCRPLRWTIRTPLLEETLAFFETNLGLQVGRHEEFAADEERREGAWSKTLLELGPPLSSRLETFERDNFNLELLYKYGVTHYKRGNDLRYLAIRRSAFLGPESSLVRDELGKVFVEAPNLWLRLIDEDEDDSTFRNTTASPFLYLSLHVRDLAASATFYRQALGAIERGPFCSDLDLMSDEKEGKVCFWWGAGVGVELVQLPAGQSLKRGEASGGLALLSNATGGFHDENDDESGVEDAGVVSDPDGNKFRIFHAGTQRVWNLAAPVKQSLDWKYRAATQARTLADVTPRHLRKAFDPSVVLLTPENYLEKVTTNQGDVLVQLFAPWCTLCEMRKPTLEAVASYLSSVATTAALDGSNRLFGFLPVLREDVALQGMLSWAGRHGFPMLFYIKATERDFPVVYEGAWTQRALLEWVQEQRGGGLEDSFAIPAFLDDDDDEVKVGDVDDDDDDCDTCSL